MKVIIKYVSSLQQPEIKEFELDEKTGLSDVSLLLSNKLKDDIILIPAQLKAALPKSTLKDYYLKTSKPLDFNFIAISTQCLTALQKDILLPFALGQSFEERKKEQSPLEAAQQLIKFMQGLLPEDVQQALVVRLSDKTTMFGETYQDTLSDEVKKGELRSSIQNHPYPWLVGGASNAVAYGCPQTGIYIALVYNRRRDRRLATDPLREKGVPDFFKLPEGYMHPRPCQGGEKGISLIPSDEMDEAEELVLKKVPMKQAYQTIKEKRKASVPMVGEEHFDNSTYECATRESREEVGIEIEKIELLSQRESNQPIPAIVNVFLLTPKSKGAFPPPLIVDGVEIKEAVWGKAHAFQFENAPTRPERVRVTLDYYDQEGERYCIEVPIKYAIMIGQAINRINNNAIQKTSEVEEGPLFNTRANVEARIKQILNCPSLNSQNRTLTDILGAPPERHLSQLVIDALPGSDWAEKKENFTALATLGKSACQYHKKILALADAFKKIPLDRPLNAEQLMTLTKEGPLLQESLMSSRARLFRLQEMFRSTKAIKKKKDRFLQSQIFFWHLDNERFDTSHFQIIDH